MIFEKLRNDDPTDFMLIPSSFYPGEYGAVSPHICGLTVYKKNDSFIIMKVDKEKNFDDHTVSYFEIPPTKILELSELFLKERFHEVRKPYFVLRRLATLSIQNESIGIPAIVMKEQKTGNCSVNEVDAALKTILFHCSKDIFSLDTNEQVTPKWHSEHAESILEMRKRFLFALKGKNPELNRQLDYIYFHYLYKKGQFKSEFLENIDTKKRRWHLQIHFLFKEDPYISAIFDHPGELPTIDENLIQEKSNNIIKSLGIYPTSKLAEISSDDLTEYLDQQKYITNIINGRLPFIQVPIAKEMTQRMIASLEKKEQEVQEELHQRQVPKETKMEQKLSEPALIHVPQKTISPIEKKVEKLKHVLIFGDEQDRKGLMERLDHLDPRQKKIPHDSKIYIELIFHALRKRSFNSKNLERAIQNNPLLKEITQVIRDSIDLDTNAVYPMQSLGERQEYTQTIEYTNQVFEEIADAGSQNPLIHRFELILIEAVKKREDVELWVPLDSLRHQMDQTIDGFRNDVFDHALRVLYLQRNQLQGRFVFWENGQRVVAPWERDPELWANRIPQSVIKNEPFPIVVAHVGITKKATIDVLPPLNEEAKKCERTFTSLDKIQPQKAKVVVTDNLKDFKSVVTQLSTVVKEGQVVVANMSSNEQKNELDSFKRILFGKENSQNKEGVLKESLDEFKLYKNVSTLFGRTAPNTRGEVRLDPLHKPIKRLIDQATDQSIQRKSQSYQIKMVGMKDRSTNTREEAKSKTHCFSSVVTRFNNLFEKGRSAPAKNETTKQTNPEKVRMATLLTDFRPIKFGKNLGMYQKTTYQHKTMSDR
ncbi:hypothetical protein [Enterococcus mundtii]|uniref:hypothetical protein n=1 Tax=Enterococcus mundtii TaxID=53346 RepID=UPI001145EEE2|nr:hypothetical protein [Enterococcus mundtii]MDB7102039.1 hypothetical protein [Enterococcus mundtii]